MLIKYVQFLFVDYTSVKLSQIFDFEKKKNILEFGYLKMHNERKKSFYHFIHYMNVVINTYIYLYIHVICMTRYKITI